MSESIHEAPIFSEDDVLCAMDFVYSHSNLPMIIPEADWFAIQGFVTDCMYAYLVGDEPSAPEPPQPVTTPPAAETTPEPAPAEPVPQEDGESEKDSSGLCGEGGVELTCQEETKGD